MRCLSAYPMLVKTLTELFDGGTIVEFLMCWNRRIAESAIFFQLMADAGQIQPLESCIQQ